MNTIENTNEKVIETTSENVENTQETKSASIIENPENPLNNVSMKQIEGLLKQVADMVRVLESQWDASRREFKLTDSQMRQVYKWNEDHMSAMPEELSDEEKDSWDRLNGIDSITEEKVIEIFGEDSNIIGIEHNITITRIKDALSDYIGWMSAIKEYRQIHNSYIELIELEEEKNILALENIARNETDPEKKQKLFESIEMYYNRKYLDFLSEPLNPDDIDRIINAMQDENKITYWINRCRDKLRQMKISSKFILEISQFEKRFLEEKYHKCSNILLAYFMQTTVYSKDNTKSACIVVALDSIIRNTAKEEKRERVLNNIQNLLDQFIDKIPDPTNKQITE